MRYPIVLPGDPRYPTLVRGFNLRWVGKPAGVAICRTPADVVAAVQQAVDAGQRITIRGGGHCYEDFVSCNDGGVILNLSAMHDVWRDGETGLYGIGGGATLWDAYRQLYVEHGVTLPGGSCYSVGAGGHVTGGGYGLLSRLHGLSIDYLEAVDVVVVDDNGTAKLVTVSRDSVDPDERDLLFGHLGGGGGNFGVVTTFWFRDLPRAPERAHLLTLGWDWATMGPQEFAALVHNYGRFMGANSDPESEYNGLFSLLHLTQRKAGQIVLIAQLVGDQPELLRTFATHMSADVPTPVPSRTAVGQHHTVAPTTDVRTLPWLYATQTLNGSGPNQRGKYASAYMKTDFPDRQVDVMWHHLSDPEHPNPQALLQVDSYGGRINAVAPDATAIPQRSSVMKLQYQTYWTDRADDDRNLAWLQRFYTRMYGLEGPLPDDTMDGCYVNYPDASLTNWALLYYKVNYPRLQRVKARWDPRNIFNHAQSIALP
jgi:FAD/FMN-containing dehydrogenase